MNQFVKRTWADVTAEQMTDKTTDQQQIESWSGRICLSTLGKPMHERKQMFKSGFDRFWAAWPKHPRKGGKAACLAKWAKTYCETQADQIVKHVEWMKTTEQWRKDNGAFIPAPLVYLNQQRWDGAEIPEPKKPVTMADQYKERVANVTVMPDHIRERLAQIRRGA